MSPINDFYNNFFRYYNDFWICLLDVWRTILTSGIPSVPNLTKFRFFFLFWLVYCINIDTAYQTKLISVLTTPRYGNQITNTEEMLASSIKFGFYPIIQNAFTDKTNPISRKILQNFHPCKLTLECVNRTAFKRDFAVVKSSRQVKYYMSSWYAFPNGYPRLFAFEHKVYNFFYCTNTIKGFPMLEQYNNLIMWFWANGLFPKWEADVLKKHIKQENTDSPIRKLTLTDFGAVFGFLVVGLLCALTRFMYEMLAKASK